MSHPFDDEGKDVCWEFYPMGKERLLAQTEYCIHVVENDAMELRFYVLQPGQIVPRETHEFSYQLLHVVEGALDVAIGSLNHRLRAGDFFLIHQNTAHELKNPGAEVVRYTSTYAPRAHVPHQD